MSTIKPLGIPKIKALGLNNLQGVEDPPSKSLSIKYISCEQKGISLILKFEVEAKGINPKETKAYLNVFRGDISTNALSSESVTKLVQINPNGRKNIEITVPIGFASNEYYYKTNKYYRATIAVEKDWSMSEGFEIKLTKQKSGEKIYATQENWDKAAKDLGVNDSDLLKAIAQQESENIAFLISGNPKILYERHHFYDFYSKKYGKIKADQLSQTNENIIKNDNGGYGSEKFFKKDGRFDNEGYYNYQFERLEKAMKIDVNMAIKSTSFGLFQVLGEYCTYSQKSEKQFFEEMIKSEIFQIQAFVNFIKGDSAKKKLPSALNNKNWRLVASIYNGAYWETYNPDYAKNIEKFYNKKPWEKKLL